MPRHPRLDVPYTLRHVMARGLERRAIFRDDADRDECVARLAALAEAGALTVYAWTLLPNHAHPLVRTGTRPLAPVPGSGFRMSPAPPQGRAAAAWARLLATC
jgi:REP element-mobilizing transposase RayT